MAKTKRKSTVGTAKFLEPCKKCGGEIPPTKRSDSVFCSETCREAAYKARYCSKNPEYVKRQRKQVKEIRHLETYGHLEYIDKPSKNKWDKFGRARELGFRSMFEAKTAEKLREAGIEFEYETLKIKYTIPEKVATYTPDIVLPNGLIVETKGRFLAADRKKHLLIQKQHPELDIRFVFQNSSNKITKGSKTSYADWATKHGFQYADKEIPKEWLKS